MDIHRMVDNFDMSSRAYRILVIIAVILIILALWIRTRTHQYEFIPETDTIPSIKISHEIIYSAQSGEDKLMADYKVKCFTC